MLIVWSWLLSQRVQLLLVVVASQQQETLSALGSLDQLISYLLVSYLLVSLQVTQKCSQTVETTAHQAKQ